MISCPTPYRSDSILSVIDGGASNFAQSPSLFNVDMPLLFVLHTTLGKCQFLCTVGVNLSFIMFRRISDQSRLMELQHSNGKNTSNSIKARPTFCIFHFHLFRRVTFFALDLVTPSFKNDKFV